MTKKGLYAVPPAGKKPKVTTKKTRNAASSLKILKKIKESSCTQYGHPKAGRTTADMYSKERSFFQNLLLKDMQMEKVVILSPRRMIWT
jgi:hypothetical protein